MTFICLKTKFNFKNLTNQKGRVKPPYIKTQQHEKSRKNSRLF
jgi:hypothetical protein